MKKIFTLLFVSLCFSAAFAQYSYIPVICAHQNPRGLNTDIEEPSGLGTTWTTIRDSSNTPVWSSVVNLPFAFNFNGAPVTSYKVSTTGVLTFATATVAVPPAANVALPSVLIPDSSICVWGINGFGYYHPKIATKTFGTAPNRQHWIWFNTFGMPGVVTNSVTFWGIMLEEGTNNIYIVDERTFPVGILSLTLGVQINATTATQVTGSPNLDAATTVLGGSYDGPTDNVYYQFSSTPLTSFNHFDTKANSLTNFGTFPYFPRNTAPFSLTGEMVNLGDSTIHNLVLNYKVNGGATVSSTSITGLNIAPGACYTYTHPTPWNPTADGVYSLKLWATALNGNNDQNHTNDTVSASVCLYTNSPVTHKVVIEEATGTWCGWCPRGAVFMDSIYHVHPATTVLLAVHNADPMTVTAYDAGVAAAVGGFPSVLVDRKFVADPSVMFTEYDNHITDFGLADIDLTLNYNTTTRVCSVNVAAKFSTTVDTWTWRLGCAFTEMHVTGTGTTWDQHNYYSSTVNNLPLLGAGHNWQTEGSSVPAANMSYDFVARNLMSNSFTGQSASLPATLTAGSTYNYTFTYTIPAGYNDTKMAANVWLLDVTNGIILNGNTINVNSTAVNDISISNSDAVVYPNPAVSSINVGMNFEKSQHATLEIMNVLGQVCISKDLGTLSSGEQVLPVNVNNLSSGTYILTVKTDSGNFTKKFVK